MVKINKVLLWLGVILGMGMIAGVENGFSVTVNNPMTENLDGGGYSIFNVADVVSKGPQVDVRAYASINAAVTAIGSTQTTLLIPNAQTLTNNLTIPSTLSLKILKGGSIVKASTYTLTINGPFDAGLYQVFSGFSAGDVTFGNGAVKEVYPIWWSQTGTGIQSAINSLDHSLNGGGIINLLNLDYNTNSTITFSTSNAVTYFNITLKGTGLGARIIWTGAANGTILRTGSLYYCHFENITFNGANTSDYCVYYGAIDGGDGVNNGNTFRNVNFQYSKYGFGLGAWANTIGLLFENCRFANNSYAGFGCGTPNGDIITFIRCDFNYNAFGVASFLGQGTSVNRTSLITGNTYTFLEGGGIDSQHHYGSIFASNSEADIYFNKVDEGLVLVGCGSEGSRMLMVDAQGFGGGASSSSGSFQNITLINSACHGFGTNADSLNNPFIKIESGANLYIQGCTFYAGAAAPRTGITLNSGYLNIQSTSFVLYADITSWPDILTYAANPYIQGIHAQNVHIRRNDLGMDYDRDWLPPVKTLGINQTTPYVKPRVPIYKTGTTSPTTISNFTLGTSGQKIIVLIQDALTTIDFTGTNLKGNAEVDWSPGNGDWMECVFDGTNWYCSVNGTTNLSGSATWDPPSLANGTGSTSLGITVTRAALGDFVLASAPYDLQGITMTAYVSAASTVKIRLQNESGGAINLASGTWKVKVIK